MKTIGRYAIRGLLGRGGMGRVYRVESPGTGRMAALKVLAPHPTLAAVAGEEKLKSLFLSEAACLGRLRHPNVVEIRDYDDSGRMPFYVMDYHANNLGIMIGETFRTDHPSRRLPVDRATQYLRQALDGLSCLHHAGLIHRDIKPYNLLVSDADVVKICDFGVSKTRGETLSIPSQIKVGSPWYAAPEQEADPEGADERADLFAMGVLFYRMLTGILPEIGPEPGRLPLVSRLNSDLTPGWDAFFSKSLARQPGDRFQTASAMRRAVDKLASEWEGSRQAVCEAVPDPSDRPATRTVSPVSLRQRCVRVLQRHAGDLFAADPQWRPLHYIANRFEADGSVVTDRATNLAWQKGGSDDPLTWDEAQPYIDHLNRTRLAGFTDWRLPTIDELMSLLKETPVGTAWCTAPVFHRRQKWLWSCDRRSHTSAWYVSVDLGFIHWHDRSAGCFVRAVRQCAS